MSDRRSHSLVFAYGSNLCVERLRARTPSARVVATGMLAGHELRWHKRSADGSGKCDAFATGDPSHLVWGAVYEIAVGEKPRLDACEGLGRDYFEREVAIRVADGRELRAWVYLANAALLDPSARPWSWYKDFVVTGARQHTLPATYRAALESVEALADPDRARHARESAVLGRRPDA